jgi:hypothetical protein
MVAKPTLYPDWATTGTRTAPSGAAQLSGWTPGQTAPAQIQNWLQGIGGDWLRWLDQQEGISGKLNLANVWTDTQLITPPGDDFAGVEVTSAPSNKWRLLLKGHTGITSSGNEAEVRVYSGDGTEGYFAIVFNAYYRHASNAWRQQNTSQDTRAIMIGPGGMRLLFKLAGSADWTTWSASNLTDVAAVPSTITWVSTRSSVYYISPEESVGAVSIDHATGAVTTDGSLGWVWFPIRLPVGAIITQIQAKSKSPSAEGFRFVQKNPHFDVVLSAASWSDLETWGTGSTGVWSISTTGTISRTVVAGRNYGVLWNPADAAALVGGFEVTWTEAGPGRNY